MHLVYFLTVTVFVLSDVKTNVPPVHGRFRSHLLLHQVFELRDLVRVFRVAADVVLIKERLVEQEEDQDLFTTTKYVCVSSGRFVGRPLGIWRCLR